MKDELKQANAELTETELTQVTGGTLPDHLNLDSLANEDSMIDDKTTTEPKNPNIAVW